jgi:FlaA1/EpsC-like NDP-sugar epimerase
MIITYIKKILEKIIYLDRYIKNFIAIVTDIFFCVLSLYIAFYLRFEETFSFDDIGLTIILLTILISTPIFWLIGFYKTLFRHAGISILYKISLSTVFYGIIFFSIISLYSFDNTPKAIGILQPMILYILLLSSRLFLKYFLTGTLNNSAKGKLNIMIYGAGEAGRHIYSIFEDNSKYNVVGFLDDNPRLHKLNLFGQKIYNPMNLEKIKNYYDIKLIIISIPSLVKSKKNEIINMISKFGIKTKTLPNLDDIIEGKLSFSDVKDFLIEDLLERDLVEADKELISKNIKSKTILVTGAGGTIGAELSKQILKQSPKKIILFELNEYSLFKIYEELADLYDLTKIIPLLGNILDQDKLEKIFKTFKVDIVFHTAAYKHVPLVEGNICEGVRNNIFGTLSVVKAVTNQVVKNLVFVSSDKAVKPTNVMGASKRLAELCIQVYGGKNPLINFSIVRFGNVLASSGSVIPKFKKQISEGGPVTLTHNEVSRFFMTAPEAAQLVIQAGAIGKNSEVFILDMGKPVRIRDLIVKMINLSGQKIKDENNLNGDLEIKTIGLRPGEKLHEELLLGEYPEKTIHPKIYLVNEPSISFEEFEKAINELTIHLNNQDAKQLKKILNNAIKFYHSNTKLIDYMYTENHF